MPIADGLTYRFRYTRQIPAIAGVAMLLGLFWALVLTQLGWSGFPPETGTVSILVLGSLLFFLSHGLWLLRRELVISPDHIEVPTSLWTSPLKLDLSRDHPTRLQLRSFSGTAIALAIETNGGNRRLVPLFVSRHESSALESYLRSIEDRGTVSLTFGQLHRLREIGGTLAKVAILPTTALGLGLVVLASAAWSGALSFETAGNLAILVFLLAYFFGVAEWRRNIGQVPTKGRLDKPEGAL